MNKQDGGGKKRKLSYPKFKESDAIDLASFQLSRFYSFYFKQSKNLIALGSQIRSFVSLFHQVIQDNFKEKYENSDCINLT